MTSQDVTTPHPQMGRKDLQELIRPHVPKMISQALALVQNADNDSVKLGAIKLLLSKVLPDLKATELTSEDSKNLVIQILGGQSALPSNNSNAQDTGTKEEN